MTCGPWDVHTYFQFHGSLMYMKLNFVDMCMARIKQAWVHAPVLSTFFIHALFHCIHILIMLVILTLCNLHGTSYNYVVSML